MDGVEDRDAQCDFEGKKGTMAELKILHSNLMAYTAKQALADVYPGERPYIINRAGYAGIQRYAQVWGGDNLTDWRTVKFNIATILGMGLSGIIRKLTALIPCLTSAPAIPTGCGAAAPLAAERHLPAPFLPELCQQR